jgi:uncharacterized protein DUF2442
MIWVAKAKALSNYRLWVQFSDGLEGELDLKEFIFADTRPIVAGLRNEQVFSDIRVESDTVVWSNGFDLAPEFLYAKATARATT